MTETKQLTYEKPEITDFGSLEELTAACSTTGSGDFKSQALDFTDSHGHTCHSN
jgi:hypothetical protein